MYFRYGVKSVTMDAVATELGISKKTLYHYFTNKENLVNEVIEYYLDNPVFNYNDERHGNPIDRIFVLRNHLSSVLKYYNNNLEYDLKKLYPAIYKKVYDYKRKKLFNEIKYSIIEGQKMGFFRESIDPGFISKLNLGRMLYTLNPEQEIFDESELTSIEIFDKTADYHLHGICTAKGLKYYLGQLNKIQNKTASNKNNLTG